MYKRFSLYSIWFLEQSISIDGLSPTEWVGVGKVNQNCDEIIAYISQCFFCSDLRWILRCGPVIASFCTIFFLQKTVQKEEKADKMIFSFFFFTRTIHSFEPSWFLEDDKSIIFFFCFPPNNPDQSGYSHEIFEIKRFIDSFQLFSTVIWTCHDL